DLFSLPVRFKQLYNEFIVQIDQPLETPPVGSGNELLLIDEGDSLRVDNVLIDIDDDPSIPGDDRYGLVVFNVIESSLVAGTGNLTVNEDLMPAGGNTIDLATLVTDLNDPNATITITSATNGANGTVSLSGSVATYTPAADFFGVDSFTYVASNGSSTSTGTVNVTVVSQNDAPTGTPDQISATRGTVRVIQPTELTNNDSAGPANEDQTLVIDSVAGTGVVLNGDGTVSFTPPASGATATFTYVVRDSDGATSDPIQVTVNIDEQPLPPTAGDFTLSGTEGTTLTFTDSDLLANVQGTSPITVDSVSGLTSLISGSGAGTLTDNGDGTYSYTPVDDDVFGNVATFDFTVSNSLGTDTGTVTINLQGVNDAPNAVDDTFNVEELSGVHTLMVLDNDDAGPGETGDSITITSVTGTGVSIAPGGTAVLYDPQELFPGQTSFTYTITDSGNLTSTATVTVDVTEGPRPRALDDTATSDEGVTIDIPVLANDRANVGETLSIDSLGPITVGAGNATISIVGDSVRVDPSDDYNGVVEFTYTVTDTSGVVDDQAAATGTVTLTIGPVNDPPIIGADPARTTTSNVPLTIAVSELLANDSPGVNEDDQTLSVSSVTAATANGGTAVLDNGNIVYTPPLNFEGTDTITYTVSDDGDPVASSQATLTINVNNIDPIAGDDEVTAFVNVPAIYSAARLLGNDSAGEASQQLTITAVNAQAGTRGTVSLESDGSVRFVPETDFIGQTSFTYTISDGIESAVGTVHVDVQEFQPSTISGTVFFDSIASVSNPVRNGTREAGESGLANVQVTLSSTAADNVTGEAISQTAYTNLEGNFSFEGLPPGRYVVNAMIGDDLIDGPDTAGSRGDLDSVENQFTVNFPQPGGFDATDYAFSLIGYSGTSAAAAMERTDLLASTYLSHHSDTSNNSNGGMQGGTASLNADGTLNFLQMRDGFEGVKHAEIVLNEARDSALLTIVNSVNEVLTARL
ncbi:MAG: Ig-like domain-containing protein, partial [Maioricimonas sp. JB049]